MKSKYLAAAMLGTMLFTGGAFAEKSTADHSAIHRDGEWRSSKLIGVNVYNDSNDKIGDIEDLIIDKSGKIDHVVLAVGGFLGVGEHYVAVPMDKLKWSNEPVRTSSTDKTTTANDTSAKKDERSKDEKWYPDHAVYNATKDQLKAMPEFKYN